MSAGAYVAFRLGREGEAYPGLWPLLAAAERGRRDWAGPIYGARKIGDSIGWERVGGLVRRDGAVELMGLEPADGPEGAGNVEVREA